MIRELGHESPAPMSLEYLIKRLGFLVLTVWLISVIVFGITQILPANAVEMLLGNYATPDQVAAVTERLGLDAPAPVQYLRWFGSRGSGRPRYLVEQRSSGRTAGVRRARPLACCWPGCRWSPSSSSPSRSASSPPCARVPEIDVGVSLGSYIGISMPEFVTATLLLVIFARPELGWLPASGYQPLVRRHRPRPAASRPAGR